MPASQLKIAPKNLVRRNIGTPEIIFFLQLKKIYHVCKGVSDPARNEKELKIQNSEMINLNILNLILYILPILIYL